MKYNAREAKLFRTAPSPDVALNGPAGQQLREMGGRHSKGYCNHVEEICATGKLRSGGVRQSRGIFAAAVLTVLLWLVTGPFFAYSDTWQLVMNTWTNIVTFLMVFVIQNSQNRDSAALQAKIDELIRVSEARNSFVGIEQLAPEEIEQLRQRAPGQVGEEARGQDRRRVAPD
jgi:low affinity Fe/Cu permease